MLESDYTINSLVGILVNHLLLKGISQSQTGSQPLGPCISWLPSLTYDRYCAWGQHKPIRSDLLLTSALTAVDFRPEYSPSHYKNGEKRINKSNFWSYLLLLFSEFYLLFCIRLKSRNTKNSWAPDCRNQRNE